MPAVRIDRGLGTVPAAARTGWGLERRLVALAIGVFAISLAALALRADDPGSPGRLSGAAATRSALADREVRHYLDQSGYTRTRTIPLDDELMRVSFFNGARVVLEAAVAPDGGVPHTRKYGPGYVYAGSRAIQTPLALVLLSAVFVLCVACVPLRRMRNLDVLALVSFAVSIVLLNERLLELSVYVAYPPLAYLGVRCLRIALAGDRTRVSPGAKPLYEEVTAAWSSAQRLRLLRVLAFAAAMMLVIVSVPGGAVGDVGFASMAGATALLEGTLPYGNLPPELVHGDTYPLLAYALYIPAALFMPVHDAFDNLDGALYVTAAAALIAAIGVYLTSARLAGSGRGGEGLRYAVAWLVFPPVVITASSGSNDMVAAACVAGAFLFAPRAVRSPAFVTVAGWVKLVPFLLVPILAARFRSRTLMTFLATVVGITFATVGWILLLGGPHGVEQMLDGVSFQSERGSFMSLWTLLGAKPLQLVFQAAVLSLTVVSAVLVLRDRSFARDPRRIAGLAGGTMIGFQLAANYWSYAYLPWVLPCVVVALLAGAPASRSAVR